MLKDQDVTQDPTDTTTEPESSRSSYKRGSIMHLRRALSSRLATYKLPQEVKVLSGPIPRNAMGKGTSIFFSPSVSGDLGI